MILIFPPFMAYNLLLLIHTTVKVDPYTFTPVLPLLLLLPRIFWIMMNKWIMVMTLLTPWVGYSWVWWSKKNVFKWIILFLLYLPLFNMVITTLISLLKINTILHQNSVHSLLTSIQLKVFSKPVFKLIDGDQFKCWIIFVLSLDLPRTPLGLSNK